MSYRTVILTIPVSKMTDGRKALEMVANEKFDTVEDIQNAICFDEHDPMAVEDLNILDMQEFMDNCNDTDDSTKEQEWSTNIDLDANWVGYVQLKNQ